jgi:4-amino-4-deoxychorismate lyase
VTPVEIVEDDGSATISAADRGLHYGDGVFETLACRDGRPRFLAAHLERLAAGCARLGMPEPPRQRLESAIRVAAARGVAGSAPAGRSLVKLILTRGASAQRGYAPPAGIEPCCIVQSFAWPADTDACAEHGVAVQYSRVPLTENPLLAGIKHLNRLDSVLARAGLAGSDCAEALLRAADGAVVCGSMSNLFIVCAGRLLTPRIERGGIAGIARGAIGRAAAALGWDVEERVLHPADVEAADEVFLTNVRIGAWPVVRLGTRRWAVGERTRRLQRCFDALSD